MIPCGEKIEADVLVCVNKVTKSRRRTTCRHQDNAVVPNHMVVPPGALALGVPAKILEGRSDVAMIRISGDEYIANARRYRASLRRLA